MKQTDVSIVSYFLWGGVLLITLCPGRNEAATSKLQTQLIPLQTEYVAGHAIKFQITLTNQGHAPTTFGLGAITTQGDKFVIKRPDGKIAPYTKPREVLPLLLLKTPIDAGETKTLEVRDIQADYNIDVPGVYTIQFIGQGIPSSNVIKITVEPNREEVNASTTTLGFSSAYTDLKRDCQLAPAKPTGKQNGDEICQGRGGYNLYVSLIPGGVNLSVLNGGPDDILLSLADQGEDYIQRPVEWRLANGKPFAVIYRVDTYDALDKLGHPSFEKKYRTGEKVLVHGLKGYGTIDLAVDGKDKRNEQKAEQLADTAYLRLATSAGSHP